MLKVEGLEKRLGLGLATSRSRLVAKIRRLGLVELQEGLDLGPKTKCLGLVSQGLVYIPVIRCQKLSSNVTVDILSFVTGVLLSTIYQL